MATYYWVGGTGTWDSTSTTNWASSSGGGGGAGFPTILDDVVFDTSSGTGAVTSTSSYSFCRNFTVTASQALSFNGNLTGIAGDVFLPSGGSTTFNNGSFTCIANSAKTITTNGKALGGLTFNGINGSWTLQDALNLGNNSVLLTAGTFNTNNQAVSTGSFSSSNTNIRAINLGSSTFAITNAGSVWATGATTNLTFNAGTSTITFTSSVSINTGGLNFYNVTFGGNNSNTSTITNNTATNTFNNLSFNSPVVGVQSFAFNGNQTVTGTLTASGASNIRRIAFYSDIVGTQRTLTVNAWSASPANLDFRDIAITGAVGTLSGTSIGDCGNNSGITFDAPKTVYWNLAGGNNWSATGWATSSGGTPDAVNFPLAQDTCVLDSAGPFTTLTVNSSWNIGTIDASARTSGTLTVATGATCNVYGDFTFGSGMSTSGTAGGYSFSKQGIQTFNTNGVTIQSSITINGGTGTLRLLSDVTQINYSTVLTSSTLDLNNFTFLTNNTFTLTGTQLRSIAFGTGAITLSTTIATTTAWVGATLTNFTLTGTPTVNVTGAQTSGTRTIQHGSTADFTEANAISVNVTAGSSTAQVILAGGFKDINLTGYAANFVNSTRTIYGNLLISTGTTVTAGANVTTFAGTSTTNDLTSNGKLLNFPIVIGGTGNTLRLLDALTQTAAAQGTFTVNNGCTVDANTFSLTAGLLNITTAASNPNIINLPSGTATAGSVTHTDGSLTMSASFKLNVTGGYTLTAGTLDFGNQSVSFGFMSSSSSNVRTVNCGSGTITITSASINWLFGVSNLTYNPGTSTLNFTSASAKGINGNIPLYNVNNGGAGALTLVATTYNTISNSVQPCTILFTSGSTATVNNLNLNGTAGNLVTLSQTAITSYTIDYTGSTVNTMNFVSVSNFTGARAGIFFATNSTNGGSNTNITFAAADTTPRYWVLGTGTWSNTATANWSTSSGGSGGASAPTIETNVIFDAASNVGTGAFTVSLSGTGTLSLVCDDVTISGLDGALTWAGAGQLTVYGSLSYPATNFTNNINGPVIFRSTSTGRTITSNGKRVTVGDVTFNGVGGGWTLTDAFDNSTSTVTVTNGTFNTGGFAVTCGTISSSNSNVRAINLGASTVTMSGSISFTTSTNLTFNAGTSNITSSANGFNINGGTGQTFNNVTCTQTAPNNTTVIAGANTFNNLTIAGPTTAGASAISIGANQTINGALSCSGTAGDTRVFVRSDVLGTQRTLVVNSFTSQADIDFRDIIATGAAAPISGTRLGDAGGNSGITFPTSKTVYWNQAGTNNFASNGWATTPSGTPATANFPLPQDVAAFTDSGAITQITVASGFINYPAIDMSARTLAMTFALSASASYYGGWINGSGTTLTGNFGRTFRGRGSYNIVSNGVSFSGSITIDCVSGTYTLTDALVLSGGLVITSGNFNSGNQTITIDSFTSNVANTRSITFGTSTINIGSAASTPFNIPTTTGLTFSGASSTINFTHDTPNLVTFSAGGLTYGTFNIGGTSGSGTYSISGSGTTFNNITKTKPVAFTISIPASTTINFNNFNVSGTAGNLVTLTGGSLTTSIYNYTGTGVVSVDYVSAGPLCTLRPFPDAAGATPYSWYLGANSVNNFTTPRNSGAAFIAGNRRAYLLTTTGVYGWTVPENWDGNNNNFYLIGAGAAGGRGAASGNNRAAGGGGGGGGYVGLTNLSLTPSSILPLNVGANASSGVRPFDTYINAQYLAGAGQVGTAAITPTSAGGAGGIGATYDGSNVFYNGGAGGAGAFGTTASQGYGAGGAGGPAGPLGNGGAGGLGFASTTQANISGGGGGGNGGGFAGGNGSSALGGTGGNNASGIGGGASNTSGTFGGGGGGGTGSSGTGVGGQGLDILNTIGGMGGSGGQGGGGSSSSAVGFGQGTGGANVTTAGSTATNTQPGGQGVIFIVYTPLSGFFVSITEAFTSNNTQSAQSVFNQSVTENSNLAAVQQATSTFSKSITESFTVADNQSVVAIFAGVITEGQGIAANQTVSGIFNADTTDGLTVASIQSASANFNSAITEGSTILSVEDAIKAVFSSITENSNLADNQSVFAYFNVTAVENFDPAALQSVQANFNSLINENLVLLDEFVGRGWFRIVDDQTVVWTNINNSQTVTWQNIGNDQNPNWVVVNNSQE